MTATHTPTARHVAAAAYGALVSALEAKDEAQATYASAKAAYSSAKAAVRAARYAYTAAFSAARVTPDGRPVAAALSID